MDILSIRILQDASDKSWLSFITADPRSVVFHHPAWLNLLSDCYGYRPYIVTVCNEKDEIIAGLPFMEIKSVLNARRWVSLPFTDYCTPLFRTGQSMDFLANACSHLLEQHHLTKVDLRWEIPLHMSISSSAQFLLQTLKLEDDFNHVAGNFDRVHRQNVRQAENNGIQVKWTDSLLGVKEFYNLQLDTRRRHGVPGQPWRFFKLIYEQLITNGFGSVLLAYRGDVCIAGLILLKWQDTLICKYAASHEEWRSLRPNNLLFWTAIRWGCENGYKTFDMGRTDLDNPGLCRFKKGWGADEMPLNYFSISRTPLQHTPANLLRIMKPIIQKSPLWVCQFAGELLYRYVG
jgi:hypothetical protein